MTGSATKCAEKQSPGLVAMAVAGWVLPLAIMLFLVVALCLDSKECCLHLYRVFEDILMAGVFVLHLCLGVSFASVVLRKRVEDPRFRRNAIVGLIVSVLLVIAADVLWFVGHTTTLESMYWAI